MTIKERYRRARKNYIRRINRAVKSGYVPNVIPIPKIKTEASIRRLEKWTGEYIRTHSAMVDIETGVLVKQTKNKKARRKREKAYKAYMDLPVSAVESVNVGIEQSDTKMSDDTLDFTQSYEQIISNWYDQIHANFYWYIAQFIEWQTNKLIEGQDDETRRRFAYVLTQNPEILPDPPYATREEITSSFVQVARMMDLAPDSEAYKDFASMYDFVESEDG